MSKTANDPKDGCIAFLLMLLIVPFSIAWKGWVFLWLWGWFVVPVFHLSTLTIPQALGLGCIASFWSTPPASTKSEGEGVWMVFWRGLFVAFAGPLLILCYAWIVHLFLR